MKQCYFIKFDRRVNKIIGCQRTTLILSTLEYWFSKKQDGFYKFIEPCSHPLYKKEDSWTEELNCDAKSFTSSFKKIGVKYRSRTAFEKSQDKFQGKMYASFYDRYSNRVFFVRNDEAVNKFFAEIYPPIKTGEPQIENKENSQSCQESNSLKNLLRNGKNSRSYKEPKKSSRDLSKDKSHANDEIIKKMIDIWTAIVEEGKGQIIELKGKIIPFLKKALTDKFDNCLQKWKEYCISIARSKFLMGEKTSFKATLDWALKFDSIHKISAGNYGIGDRNRKLTPEELEEREKQLEEQKKAKELEQQSSLLALEEEIKSSSNEPGSVKNFRIKWLRRFGEKNYREFLAGCEMKLGEKETDLIIQPQERITAIRLGSYWNPELLSGQPFKRVQIYHCIPDLMGNPLIFDRWFGGFEEIEAIDQKNGKNINDSNGSDEPVDETQNTETSQLRTHLKAHIPAKEYPTWLGSLKVQAIKPDGTLVVNFTDQFTADYAGKRFFQEILEAATGLWGEVTSLVIQKEPSNLEEFEGSERSKIDEETRQAIQSLIGAGFSGGRRGANVLNDWVPY
jgi:hypothetical protein